MDVGLLVIRLVVGAVLFAHATQKLCGWFSGPGLAAATTLFHNLGQRPASVMVRIAAGCELAGAVLLISGTATPLGVLIVVSTMLVAGSCLCLLNGSLWNSAGGGEYPFVLAAMTAVLAFTGPGRWSVDAAVGAWWIGETNFPDFVLGWAVVAGATVAAAPAVFRTRRVLAAQQP